MSATRWWMLLAFAAAALGFVAGRWTAAQPPQEDPLRALAEFRFDWLVLTPAQAAEVERLKPTFQSTLSAGCDARCAARCALVRALTAPEWDREKARDAVERMCAAHRATELAALDYLDAVRAVLSPGQQARLLARVGACLCETCARNENACCVPEGGAP